MKYELDSFIFADLNTGFHDGIWLRLLPGSWPVTFFARAEKFQTHDYCFSYGEVTMWPPTC